MTAPEPTRALFACDGAAVPPALRDQRWDTVGAISARGGDPDLTLVLEGLAGKVVGVVDPRAVDLVRIAAFCYAADLRVRRHNLDVHREDWRRELTLCVAVEDPGFWSDPAVERRLVEALDFATDDAWAFVFTQAAPGVTQLPFRWDGRTVLGDPGAVVLFSGGSDSLCALVAARHDRPIPVSHWPARHIKGRQELLLGKVRDRFPGWAFPPASFEIHRRGDEKAESSQRSRAFLYACLGAVIAAHYGLPEVRFADNGYVSVNPPITDQLVGALASRGTHPKFLHLANRILGVVFPAGVRLVNPLWDRTRAEAFGILAEAGCADLLRDTYTCGKQQGFAAGKHLCGGCSQCVDRRIAAAAAGLEAHDPVARYELDLFADELPEGEPRTVALSYLRFAHKTARMEPQEIVEQTRELDACVPPDDPEFWAKTVGIGAMLKRHAEEAMRIVGREAERRGAALTWHDLPLLSLLPLWIGDRGGTGDGERFGVRPEADVSTFARSGPVWLVAFRGEKGHYPHLKGMTQLAHLLENPKRPLDVLALGRSEAIPADGSGVPVGTLPGIGGSLGDLMSPKGMKAMERYLVEHPGRLDAARAAGRLDEVKRLRDEEQTVRRHLRAAKALRGKPRQQGGPEERARKAVSKNVLACYARFRAQIPGFVAHAARFVHLGIPPVYEPDPPERWTVRR